MPYMRSSVVYLGNMYIGCTNRTLRTRMCEHLRLSGRTHVQSNISLHLSTNSYSAKFEDFSILKTAINPSDLQIIESILIKRNSPSLNKDKSSSPLYIA